MSDLPIRILHVITGMGSGGAEMMIMNWYRNIDRSKVQFDFLLRSPENIYAEEIESMGGRVYYTSTYPRHYFRNKRETKRFFKEHASEYAAIHVHCNALLYVNVFGIAKKYGIKTRIIHSHSTQARNRVFGLVHKLNKKRVQRMATHLFACSGEAGEWAFSPNGRYRVITNGIDTQKYGFDSVAREDIREELGIQDKFVIGHVGRFLKVKNHKFILEFFKTIESKRHDVALLLVGTGTLEGEIKRMVVKMGLSDKVHFLGVRNDVEKIYSAMDVFVLPSEYEGVGIVLIEAQVSGVHCFSSNCIPKAIISENRIERLPIDNAELWAEHILNKFESTAERRSYTKEAIECGYDVFESAGKLQEIYLQLSEQG